MVQRHFDRIILVSTNLQDSERLKVSSACEVVVRDNTGYDFYSYRTGILQLLAENPAFQITLMNTSFIILEPEKLIRNYVEGTRHSLPSDVYGLTMSQEHFPHIQSFLMTLSASLWSQQPFIDWWQQMEPVNDRQEVINRYEIGLSLFMTAKGLSLSSAFDHPPTAPILNPTHGSASALFDAFGIVKIETYRQNPHQLDLGFLLHDNVKARHALLEEGMLN